MKENADKHLDDLSRKVIGKSSVESPSFDFTRNVMSQVSLLVKTQRFTYKPLISKWMWFIISMLAASGVIYVLFVPKTESLWLQKLSIDDYLSFPNFEVSQTTLYIFILFAIMFSIQLPILKRQLDKRFE